MRNDGERDRPTRIVVGITGATGAIFGVRTLERLRGLEVETHLVVSRWGARTVEHETSHRLRDLRALATKTYKATDQAALISSGSFPVDGTIIAPCSARTLASIASGYAHNLLARAAEVTLKEGRPLVLVVRESPLSAVHLENMLKLARLGVRIVPPMPAFYNHPATLGEVIDYIVVRALDQLGFSLSGLHRWDGELSRRSDD